MQQSEAFFDQLISADDGNRYFAILFGELLRDSFEVLRSSLDISSTVSPFSTPVASLGEIDQVLGVRSAIDDGNYWRKWLFGFSAEFVGWWQEIWKSADVVRSISAAVRDANSHVAGDWSFSDLLRSQENGLAVTFNMSDLMIRKECISECFWHWLYLFFCEHWIGQSLVFPFLNNPINRQTVSLHMKIISDQNFPSNLNPFEINKKTSINYVLSLPLILLSACSFRTFTCAFASQQVLYYM